MVSAAQKLLLVCDVQKSGSISHLTRQLQFAINRNSHKTSAAYIQAAWCLPRSYVKSRRKVVF